MGKREEARRKKGPPGGDIGRIAAGTRHGAELAAFALEFLNKIGSQAALAERLRDFHIDVAVRSIVVEKDASFAGGLFFQFQEPLATALAALDGVLNLVLG